MVEDRPDLVLLQEVPVWAGAVLGEATGMGVTLAPAYGAHVPFLHVPLPLAVGAAVGKALPDLVRTQIEGQANAVLYGSALLLVSARRVQINPASGCAASRGSPSWCGCAIAAPAASSCWQTSTPTPATTTSSWSGPATCSRGSPGGADGAGRRPQRDAALARRARAGGRGWLEESTGLGLGIDHIMVRGMEVDVPTTPWQPERRDLSLDDGPPVRLSDHDPSTRW